MATTDGLELPQGKIRLTRRTLMPMKIMKTYLSRIAEKLELPTKASAEGTRQIIKGKLLEMGREPPNVQIELEAREEDSEFILLRDVDRVFLEIEPPMKEPIGNIAPSQQALIVEAEHEVGGLTIESAV